MKTNMMKKISLAGFFCAALLAFNSTITYSQGRFSVGPELSLPIGSFSDGANVGFGGSLRYETPIDANLTWMVTAGYLSYSFKNIPSGFTSSSSIIPVMGGVKYYFTENFNGFYASGALGLSFLKASFTGPSVSVSSSETKFTFAPGIGYHIANIDFSGSFQLVSDANSLNIRVAYVFGAK